MGYLRYFGGFLRATKLLIPYDALAWVFTLYIGNRPMA